MPVPFSFFRRTSCPKSYISFVWLVVIVETLVETEAEGEKKRLSRRFLLSRYFLHGIAFSLLLSILEVAWVFIAAFLIIGFWMIGLLVGFVLLLFIIGGLNTFLAESIWHLGMKENWQSILTQGFFLFIALFFAGIPSLIMNLAIPSWITAAALFLAYCFVDGFICFRIAYVWEKRTGYDGILSVHD